MTKDKASDARPPQIHIEKSVIDDYGLNVNAGWLYVVIVSHVNGQSGVAFPSYTRLTKLTGMSRPTINKYIKVLEDKGLIEVIREKVDGTNERGVNHYRILPATRGSKTDLPPGKAEVVKEVNHVVNEINHPSKAGLPQVVKEVAYNYIESNYTELTKEKDTPHRPVFEAWAEANFDYTDTKKVNPKHRSQIGAFEREAKEAYQFQFEVTDDEDTARAVRAFCHDWRSLQNGKKFSNADTMVKHFAPFIQSKWRRVEPPSVPPVSPAEPMTESSAALNQIVGSLTSLGQVPVVTEGENAAS